MNETNYVTVTPIVSSKIKKKKELGNLHIVKIFDAYFSLNAIDQIKCCLVSFKAKPCLNDQKSNICIVIKQQKHNHIKVNDLEIFKILSLLLIR